MATDIRDTQYYLEVLDAPASAPPPPPGPTDIECTIFQVNVNRSDKQGYMDINPATGQMMQPSVQRTMYNTGKNLTYREHADGTLFADCSYWTRYTSEVQPEETAFVKIIGNPAHLRFENFPRAFTDFPVLSSDTFDTNFIDIDCVGYAKYVKLTNIGPVDITVKINNDSIMLLQAGQSQVLRDSIKHLAFAGGLADVTLGIVLSIFPTCTT